MQAVDTNLLVRYLTNDDLEQADQVRRLFNEHARLEDPLLVLWVVSLELIWVLGATYHFKRSVILEGLEKISGLQGLQFQDAAYFAEFMEKARSTSLDLADLIIGTAAKTNRCLNTITFDRKAGRDELFQVLS